MIVYGAVGGLGLALLRLLVENYGPSGRTQDRRGAAPIQVPPLRWWPLAVTGLAVQWTVVLGPGGLWPLPSRVGALWLGHAAIVAVLVANARRPWMGLLVAGFLLNALVMAANGGLMPVSPQTLVQGENGHVLSRVAVGQPLPRSKDVILWPAETRLAFLSDVLVIPGHPGSFSPGDVLIGVGAALVVQASVARRQRGVPAHALSPDIGNDAPRDLVPA